MNTPASSPRRSASMLALLVSTLVTFVYPAAGADNPVHSAPPREVVNPLYEGKGDAASLAPLQAWAKQRCADGTCTAEAMQRELQAVMNEIHESAMKGHRILLDDIKAARSAREALLREVTAARASGQPVRALADRIGKLPAIPARVWGDPHVDQITTSSAKQTSGSSASSASSSSTGAGRTVTASSPAAAGDLDLDAIAEKLKTDLAALTSLAQQTQADMQKATQRMQQATAELARQSKAAHDIAMNAIRNMKG